jgi:prophage regulatory protein
MVKTQQKGVAPKAQGGNGPSAQRMQELLAQKQHRREEEHQRQQQRQPQQKRVTPETIGGSGHPAEKRAASKVLGGNDPPAQQLLRRPAVQQLTGLPVSTIYALMARGKFPRPVPLMTPFRVAWIRSEIESWIAARIAEGRGGRAA